jgi:uncharacterized membrane protein
MKKAIAIFATIGILLTTGILSQQALAKSDHANNGQQVKNHGLENALDHVKNKHAREAIRRALERKTNKEADRDDYEKHQLTDLQRVEKDKQALAIDYGGSDTAESVTVPFDSLPNRGDAGSIITWISSNTAVISNDGKTVILPPITSADIHITLTATLKYGDASSTKSFTVTVKALMTDSEKVAADKNALVLGFGEGDTASSITGPLTLATSGHFGSSINWLSSVPAIISNDGKIVNRPVAGSGDAVVVITAIISSHSINDVKMFQVIVKQQLTDAQKAAADKAILAVGFQTGDSVNSVTHPLVLTTLGINGSTISWASNNTAIISNNGKIVNRPTNGSGDASIVLTALITSNGSIEIKAFSLTVKQQLTDAQKVAADKIALTIGFKGTDTAYSVTSPLTLPTNGWNGSTILWISSNEPVLSNDGKTVVRPNGATNVQVTLTAIIVSGGNTDIKSFIVTVIHL